MKFRIYLFFLFQFFLTALGVFLVGREMILGKNEMISWLWLLGFGILFWNVVYLFLMSVFSLFIKPAILPGKEILKYPRTGLCYFTRNEDTALLYKRIDWSIQGNQIPNLDYWILSDSGSEWESPELEMIRKLQKKYGHRVFYRRRSNPVERKQGNLHDFIVAHPEYDFLYISDADSMVPPDTILKLLAKAEHPENRDIAIFQTLIRTAHAKTYYARFEGIASETGQRLFFKTHQALFASSISFGHHCLIRRKDFEKIKLPQGLLSHDNWDTALLDQLGCRVVFLPEIETYDEAP
ncbi:MAG: glycosyltransferase, partial [Candidatus Omnitrophica bacterium]|nr:glycosyltransferase [Candidatus Omnitrophota bacterium]